MSEKPPIADTIRMMDIVDRLQRSRNDGVRARQGDEALLEQVRQIYVEQGLEVDNDIINKAFFELRGRAPQALVPLASASDLFKLQGGPSEEDLFDETEESDWEETDWEDEFLTEELSDLLPEDEWGDEIDSIERILAEPSGFEMVVSAGALTTVLLSTISAVGWALDWFKAPPVAANPVTCSGTELACTADALIPGLTGPVSWMSLSLAVVFAVMTLRAIVGLWKPGCKNRVGFMVRGSLLVALFANLPVWLSWIIN